MILERADSYRRTVRHELESAFAEDLPPQTVAASFSFGIFVTALPTLGTGLLLFVLVAALFDNVSKVALFASALVLNPVVKWGVYAASFSIGALLLGPVDDATTVELSFDAGTAVVVRLLVGNLILAVVFAVIAYVFAMRVLHTLRRRDVEPVELVP